MDKLKAKTSVFQPSQCLPFKIVLCTAGITAFLLYPEKIVGFSRTFFVTGFRPGNRIHMKIFKKIKYYFRYY